jgi:hypothetical protein
MGVARPMAGINHALRRRLRDVPPNVAFSLFVCLFLDSFQKKKEASSEPTYGAPALADLRPTYEQHCGKSALPFPTSRAALHCGNRVRGCSPSARPVGNERLHHDYEHSPAIARDIIACSVHKYNTCFFTPPKISLWRRRQRRRSLGLVRFFIST